MVHKVQLRFIISVCRSETHLSLIIPIPTAVFCTWCNPFTFCTDAGPDFPPPWKHASYCDGIMENLKINTTFFVLWKMQKQNVSVSTRNIHFTTRSAFNFEVKNLWAYLRPPNDFLVIASNKRPRSMWNKKIFAAVWRAERHTTGL